MAIPLFQLDDMEHATEVQRLAQTCRSVGFFYVAAHGVDADLVRELEAQSHTFFALPLEDKLRIRMERGGRAWRGYFPPRGELTSGVPDLKEGLYFGEPLGADDPRVVAGWPLHGANLYPDLPRFREVVEAYMRELARVGQRVLRALALALDVEPSWFATHLTGRPTSLFRIFHYPAPAAGEEHLWGVGEHTDYGLLTLLWQDARGGLEVKTADGWVGAPPVEGTLVCNLGDMLDRLTGGHFRSNPHRVRNTSGASRLSCPFFLDPAFDARIVPLPVALARPVDQDAAERWDRASVHALDGTYGDYLRAKVSRVFPELTRVL